MSGSDKDDDDWQYGDIWKKGSPDAEEPDGGGAYVDILRGDTGDGFDDTVMIEMIGFLGSRGIRATYDSFAIGMEPAAIKTYVLKVEEGSEDEARRLLTEEFGL